MPCLRPALGLQGQTQQKWPLLCCSFHTSGGHRWQSSVIGSVMRTWKSISFHGEGLCEHLDLLISSELRMKWNPPLMNEDKGQFAQD